MCVGCMYSRCGCVLFVVINVGIQAKCLCINTVLACVFVSTTGCYDGVSNLHTAYVHV